MYVIRVKTIPKVYRDMVVYGKRLSAEEAMKLKIVDFMVPDDNLNEQVNKYANEVADKSKFRDSFRALKKQMYDWAYGRCQIPPTIPGPVN